MSEGSAPGSLESLESRWASARKEWKLGVPIERRPGSQEEQRRSVASVKLDKPHESLLVLFY